MSGELSEARFTPELKAWDYEQDLCATQPAEQPPPSITAVAATGGGGPAERPGSRRTALLRGGPRRRGAAGCRHPPSLLLPQPMSLLYTPSVDNS